MARNKQYELKAAAFKLANEIGNLETENNLARACLENIEITIANHIAGSSRTTINDIKIAVETWRKHVGG